MVVIGTAIMGAAMRTIGAVVLEEEEEDAPPPKGG